PARRAPLGRVPALHQARRATRRRVLVNHALGAGLVEALLRDAHELLRALFARSQRFAGVLHAGLELGAHGLVADATFFVLAVALLLRLDVCHLRLVLQAVREPIQASRITS